MSEAQPDGKHKNLQQNKPEPLTPRKNKENIQKTPQQIQSLEVSYLKQL
jgi:hypothetical protein